MLITLGKKPLLPRSVWSDKAFKAALPSSYSQYHPVNYLNQAVKEKQQLLFHIDRMKEFLGHFHDKVKVALDEKKHIRFQLEKCQKENEELQVTLKNTVVMKEDQEKSQNTHQPQLEELRAELTMYSTALKDKEDLLQMECLRWQREKTSLLETQETLKKTLKEMEEAQKKADTQGACLQERVSQMEELEKSRDSFGAQLKEEKLKNNILSADLKKAEQLLQSQRSYWQQEKSTLTQRINAVQKTMQERVQEIWKTVEKSKASYQAQLEEHKATNAKMASDLKRVEAQLEQKTSKLEEMEKSQVFCGAQLEEESQKNTTLVAALAKSAELLETHKIQQDEEISTLHQVIESLKKCLQEKKHEWEESQSTMRSQLEDLQDQLTKKKKKKKWYRKLF